MIIYKITNKLNGKCYIGQTTQKLNRRLSMHRLTNKSAISLALKKYGEQNFSISIIDAYNNITDLNNAEEYYIDFHNCLAPNGYNLTTGGGNRTVSDETRKKLSESHKGKKHSPETKLKRSLIFKGHRPYNTKPNKTSFPSKKVKCITLDKTYNSLAEASRDLNVRVAKISLVCQGKRKHTKNLVFKYVEVR